MRKSVFILVTFEMPREKDDADFFRIMNPGYKENRVIRDGVEYIRFSAMDLVEK